MSKQSTTKTETLLSTADGTIKSSFMELRQKNKLGSAAAIFMLFKSCVGLGMFSYPYAYGKVGNVYGAILSVLVNYMATYGMYCIAKAAIDIEDRIDCVQKMSDYKKLLIYLGGKRFGRTMGHFLGNLVVFLVIFNNTSVIMSVLIDTNPTGLTTSTLKLISMGIYLLITLFALQPEKLKIFAYLSGAGVTLLAFWMYFDNMFRLLPGHSTRTGTHFDWNFANTGIFVGIGGWAYEAAGTIFTVKETMRDRREMPGLIRLVFSFVGVLFIMFSLSFNFAYGNNDLKGNAFEYYTLETNPAIFSGCLAIFVLLTLFTPLYNISNSELLEEYKPIARLISKRNGQICERRLFLFRATLFMLCCSFAFLTDKVTIVLNLGGAIVIPIISFYLPVLVNFMYADVYGVKRSYLMILHDLVVVLFGIAVQALSLDYTIKKQILGGQ